VSELVNTNIGQKEMGAI